MQFLKKISRKTKWVLIKIWNRGKLFFPFFNAAEKINQATKFLEAKNIKDSIEYLEVALKTYPKQHPWVYATLCVLSYHQKDYPRAMSSYRVFKKRVSDQQIRYSELAMAASKVSEDKLALQLWKKLDPNPGAPLPLSWQTAIGLAYLGVGQVEKAIKYLTHVQATSDDPEILWSKIDVQIRKTTSAQEAAKIYELLFHNLQDTLHSQVKYTHLLLTSGKTEEAEIKFQELNKRFPQQQVILAGLAKTADESRQYALSEERWKELVELYPQNNTYQGAYLQSLLNQLKIKEAEKYLSCIRTAENPLFFQLWELEIYRIQANFDKVLVGLRKLQKKYPDNYIVVFRLVNILLLFQKMGSQTEFPLEAIRVLNGLDEFYPHDIGIKQKKATSYIRANQFEKAFQLLESIPDTNSQRDLEFKAWMEHQKGNLPKAKAIWKQIMDIHSVPQTKPVAEGILVKKDTHPIDLPPNSHLVFTVVRNERWRLPWFFQYYRNLGVQRFFFVDNDSDDGTLEYLLEQSDTHIFWTNQSYAKGYSGMKWVNHLIDQYGKDQWCIYVDVDEALVFPGVEHSSIPHLTAYMAKHGHEALTGFMCDMYSDEEPAISEEVEYTNFMEDYPYFDNSYVFLNSIYCPYFFISGGVRGRIMGVHENQTKTPIIRGGRGIKFLMSSHQITPAAVSDVTCVLLHFKLSGDFRRTFAEDATKNDRMPYCKQRYMAYTETLKTHRTNSFTTDASSIRFRTSDQLVELGLLKKPTQFE